MYPARRFPIWKMKFPKQKDIKKQPVFACLQRNDDIKVSWYNVHKDKPEVGRYITLKNMIGYCGLD